MGALLLLVCKKTEHAQEDYYTYTCMHVAFKADDSSFLCFACTLAV